MKYSITQIASNKLIAQGQGLSSKQEIADRHGMELLKCGFLLRNTKVYKVTFEMAL